MKFKIFESKEKSSVTLILLTISKHQKHNVLLKTPKNMRDLKKPKNIVDMMKKNIVVVLLTHYYYIEQQQKL